MILSINLQVANIDASRIIWPILIRFGVLKPRAIIKTSVQKEGKSKMNGNRNNEVRNEEINGNGGRQSRRRAVCGAVYNIKIAINVCSKNTTEKADWMCGCVCECVCRFRFILLLLAIFIVKQMMFWFSQWMDRWRKKNSQTHVNRWVPSPWSYAYCL